MDIRRPGLLIGIGAVLLVLGVVLPLLMVIKVVESTFFLNFFSYTCMLLGMVLSTIGLAYYTVQHRKH